MSETIKQYTLVASTAGALCLAEAGEALFFRHDKGCGNYARRKLIAIFINTAFPYKADIGGQFESCYTMTEIDPCQSPEGFPELEPWMAYVGKDLKPEDYPNIPDQGGNQCFFAPQRHSSVWKPGCNIFGGGHLAIDVRTAWSQEHFPEHCRIRNYQEPDAFDIAWDAEPNKSCSESIARFFYELGQYNPIKLNEKL
jgi:hypothetical protein